MTKMLFRNAIPVVAAMAIFWAIALRAQTAPSGEQKTLTGVVSDTMCGNRHMPKDKTPAECVRQCIKMGDGFALVVGDTVYALRGHSADLDKYAGQKVTLTGTLRGNTVAVESVAPANE
jgi:hypothetical protein